MRFLIVGENHSWSSEVGYSRSFNCAGYSANIWNNKKPYPIFLYRNWWSLSRFSKVVYNAYATFRFIQIATRTRYDVIFMPKAENIYSEAVKLVKHKTRARFITWYPDHPFKSNMTSMNILRNLPQYDLFYIWGKFLMSSIKAAGAPDVRYLPFCFDPDSHPSDVEPNEADFRKFGCDVCFIGAWDLERERDLEPLANFDLAIWGPGWLENVSSYSPLKKFVRGSGVYNADLVKAYKCSSIVFNQLRLHNGNAHNVRSMEIAGIGGGTQVVRRTPELSRELFQEDEHLICFQDQEELMQKIQFLLNNPLISNRISASARKKVFSDHLLKYRIENILSDLKKLLSYQKE
jgi:spore maturation protein CgeB